MLFRIPLPNQAKCEKQATTKVCSKCGKEKSVTEFHKHKGGKYGVRSACKACVKAYHARYYAENCEKALAYSAKYQKANPDKRRANHQRRRARKANALGTFTAADWKFRLAYHGYKCIYCGVEKYDTPQGWLTCEHLIPLSRGGSNWPSNLAPSCQSCNSSKGTKTHFEYLEYLDGQ